MLILIELHPFYFRPLLQSGKTFLNSIPAVLSACRSSAVVKIVCTPLSKSWIKVSHNRLRGDPGELFDASFPPADPLESHMYRVVDQLDLLYVNHHLNYRNVMQGGIKRSANFIILCLYLVFFLYEAWFFFHMEFVWCKFLKRCPSAALLNIGWLHFALCFVGGIGHGYLTC